MDVLLFPFHALYQGCWKRFLSCHPDLKQGPLGPEALRNRYGMQENDILRLYRLLYEHSVGFCTAVLEPTKAARHRDELLETVFQTYAKLWDEALGVRPLHLPSRG